MSTHSSLTDEQIIDCLKAYYKLDILSLKLLPLGADMNASVYKAETSQATYFVKLKYGHHPDISIDILKLLHRANIQQIISPLKTGSGESIQRVGHFTFIVYPFIEGENGFNQSLTDEQWVVLGRTLRQIHEINVPVSIQQRLRQETYSPKWRNIVRSFLFSFQPELADDDISFNFLSFIKEKTLSIHRLLERAEYLSQQVQSESSPFVLCHSDLHGGNVLIGDPHTFYIVDWDDPILAPKERDLMFIGGGVGNVWNHPSEELLFYQGYGKTEINRTILAYYRHERIVEDIAEFCRDLISTTASREDRLNMYQHFIAMFKSRGVIDIAFETDIQ